DSGGRDIIGIKQEYLNNIKDIYKFGENYNIMLETGETLNYVPLPADYIDNGDTFYKLNEIYTYIPAGDDEISKAANDFGELVNTNSWHPGAETIIGPNTDFPQGFLDYFAINPEQLQGLTPQENADLSAMLGAWNDNVEYVREEAAQLFQKGYSGKAEEFFASLQTIKGSKLTDGENSFWAGILNSCNKNTSGNIVPDVIKQKIEDGLNKLTLD
ncbi:MAG: hypothetical protein WC146_02630, partial [Patescibacteria group bacterium]